MSTFSLRRRSIGTILLAVALSAVAQPTLFAEEAFGVVLPAAQIAPDAGGVKTVAVVAVTSYGDLVNDVNFVGSLASRPQLGQMLEGTIALFTQGKGLAGLDKSKPWGVILQTDGQQFMPIACLPVTDLNAVLGIVQGFGVAINDGADGTKEIALPNGKTVHVKTSGGWAFVSQTAEALATAPDDPQATLGQLVTDYDLGVRISMQNVPPMYRQMAIEAMKSGMQQGLERKANEDEQDYQMRRQMAETQIAQVERMVNEIDDVTMGWAVDAQQQRTFLDFTYRFLRDSKMARQIASYGQPHTNFAGFYQADAAVTASFSSQCDPQLIKDDLDQMRSVMQTMRKQAEKALDEEADIPDDATRTALKAALGDMLDAAQATIEAGQIDGGAAMHLHPDSLTLVAGMIVKEPAKIESALKKVAAVAGKEPGFSGVQWNAANHAGVNLHTFSLPVPEDKADARKLLGDKVDVAVGISANAVYLAVGRDNMNALNQALDASTADPNKAVPPFEFSVSLGPIMATAAANTKENDREMVQAIADMLQNEAQGRDHIRATGKLIENGLRYRVEAEEGVLRSFGKAAAMAQQKAALQQQQGQR